MAAVNAKEVSVVPIQIGSRSTPSDYRFRKKKSAHWGANPFPSGNAYMLRADGDNDIIIRVFFGPQIEIG